MRHPIQVESNSSVGAYLMRLTTLRGHGCRPVCVQANSGNTIATVRLGVHLTDADLRAFRQAAQHLPADIPTDQGRLRTNCTRIHGFAMTRNSDAPVNLDAGDLVSGAIATLLCASVDSFSRYLQLPVQTPRNVHRRESSPAAQKNLSPPDFAERPAHLHSWNKISLLPPTIAASRPLSDGGKARLLSALQFRLRSSILIRLALFGVSGSHETQLNAALYSLSAGKPCERQVAALPADLGMAYISRRIGARR